MGEFFQTTKIKKARHDHQCYLCGKSIIKGSPYTKHTGIYEGDFFETKHHNRCDDWLNKYLSEEGYREYSTDVVEEWMFETHCRECEKYDGGECEDNPYLCEIVNKGEEL